MRNKHRWVVRVTPKEKKIIDKLVKESSFRSKPRFIECAVKMFERLRKATAGGGKICAINRASRLSKQIYIPQAANADPSLTRSEEDDGRTSSLDIRISNQVWDLILSMLDERVAQTKSDLLRYVVLTYSQISKFIESGYVIHTLAPNGTEVPLELFEDDPASSTPSAPFSSSHVGEPDHDLQKVIRDSKYSISVAISGDQKKRLEKLQVGGACELLADDRYAFSRLVPVPA